MNEPQASMSHPSHDEFAALLEESLKGTALQEGSVIKGTIVGIEKDVAVIDVRVTGASAVATCDVTREVVLRIARTPQTTSRTTFHLQLAGGVWVIERVIREVR